MEITCELLSELVKNKNVRKIREIFDEYNIVDLAEVYSNLSIEDAIFIFKVLKKDISADLFSYLDGDKQAVLISAFTSVEIQSVLDNLFSDDIVEFLEEMPATIVKKIISSVDKEHREEINKLLSYKSGTAGSIMSTDYVELDENDTVTKAMRKIKQQGKIAETINYCFILNKHNALCGIVSLRDILFAPEDEIIAEIMSVDVISVKTNDHQEDVAKTIQKYDITIVPVVDDSNRLVGVVTVDDVIDTLQEAATEDIHKMGGIAPIEGSYLKTSAFKMAKSRLLWLMILMVSYAISSLIISNNNSVLIAVPSLITFMPMLMDTAGNAGSQASAMVIRGITVDDLTIKDFFKVLFKEFRVALVCGLILFSVNTLRIVFFVPNAGWDIGLTVSISVFFVVLMAKMVGGFLPLFALVIKQDPAAMASPLITTLVDAISLSVYFGLARILLKV